MLRLDYLRLLLSFVSESLHCGFLTDLVGCANHGDVFSLQAFEPTGPRLEGAYDAAGIAHDKPLCWQRRQGFSSSHFNLAAEHAAHATETLALGDD